MKRLLISLAWAYVHITPLILVLINYFDVTDREFWLIFAAGLWASLTTQLQERLKNRRRS